MNTKLAWLPWKYQEMAPDQFYFQSENVWLYILIVSVVMWCQLLTFSFHASTPPVWIQSGNKCRFWQLIFVEALEEFLIPNLARTLTQFATLETKSILGRIASRSRLWDHYRDKTAASLTTRPCNGPTSDCEMRLATDCFSSASMDMITTATGTNDCPESS